jgi:hypothetical protein
MDDREIAVLVDAGGQPWFASVLGAAREVYGLVLYRGEAGLRVLQRTFAARDPADWEELRYAQDGLTVWFGPKSELRKEERDRYAALDYRPARGARLAWPSFLDHRPGCVPWVPEAGDVAWLIEMFPAMVSFAELMRAHPNLSENRGQFEYPLISPKNPPSNPNDLDWRLWDAEPERHPSQAVHLNDLAIEAQIRALPVGPTASWDVDWFFLPGGVVDGGRPYYPRSFLIFETRSGVCLAMDVINATDDIVERATNQLVALMLRSGSIPQRVRVRRPEFLTVLQPWLAGLGSVVELADRLESAEEFRRGMMQFMDRV